MRKIWSVAPCFFLLSLACASAGSRSGPQRDSQVITEEEIGATRAANAYDAVRVLRGNFLSYRGKTSITNPESSPLPTVYLDDQELGPLVSLKSIPTTDIVEIRLYRSWEATTKYGARNMGGVIAVATRH